MLDFRRDKFSFLVPLVKLFIKAESRGKSENFIQNYFFDPEICSRLRINQNCAIYRVEHGFCDGIKN